MSASFCGCSHDDADVSKEQKLDLEELAVELAAKRASVTVVEGSNIVVVPTVNDTVVDPTVNDSIHDREPLDLVWNWDGVGGLYQGFFLSVEPRLRLATELSRSMAGPVDMHVRYDSQEFIGQIRVRLQNSVLSNNVTFHDDKVDFAGLVPVTMALAQYRETIASRYDIRVASFQVGIETIGDRVTCELSISGDPPADGSVISPCIIISGVEKCGEPTLAGYRFKKDNITLLQRCFGGT